MKPIFFLDVVIMLDKYVEGKMSYWCPGWVYSDINFCNRGRKNIHRDTYAFILVCHVQYLSYQPSVF